MKSARRIRIDVYMPINDKRWDPTDGGEFGLGGIVSNFWGDSHLVSDEIVPIESIAPEIVEGFDFLDDKPIGPIG